MVRKPTRRGIRRRSTRNRTGGTVYQSDTVIDRAADILLSSPAVQEPTMKNCLGCRVPAGT
ncbi:hypothetical protein DMC63_38025, partial [Streptomyces sp. WAC 05977]